MKKLTPALFALALLCACTPQGGRSSSSPTATPTPTPGETFVFTRENFPRLDGSTATVPLGEAIASVLLGESRENVADLIHFSKTTGAYNALMAGEADLLVVAEAGEATYAQRDEQGLEWSQEPIATEALVFMVNADNPVDSLTVEEIQKIYTGEITNWSQVGGEDREIVPFQRNKGGGSQAIMEKEVMGDLEMMQPANTEYFIGTMEGLIEAVRSFDGSPAAIGYTVYYYAEDMNMADGLKLLKVDGVEPNDDTIRSGAYPFRTFYYAVMNAGEPEDGPTAILYRWLLSPEGQKLVDHEGYVAVLAPEE